jgi:hypothetical protein
VAGLQSDLEERQAVSVCSASDLTSNCMCSPRGCHGHQLGLLTLAEDPRVAEHPRRERGGWRGCWSPGLYGVSLGCEELELAHEALGLIASRRSITVRGARRGEDCQAEVGPPVRRRESARIATVLGSQGMSRSVSTREDGWRPNLVCQPLLSERRNETYVGDVPAEDDVARARKAARQRALPAMRSTRRAAGGRRASVKTADLRAGDATVSLGSTTAEARSGVMIRSWAATMAARRGG